MILFIGGVTARDKESFLNKLQQSQNFSDTCNYKYVKRCGDQCVFLQADCYCGSDTLWGSYPSGNYDEYCCIPSDETCTKEPAEIIFDNDVICSQGQVIPKSSHCNNTERNLQCYNSYQDSLYILDPYYTCFLSALHPPHIAHYSQLEEAGTEVA